MCQREEDVKMREDGLKMAGPFGVGASEFVSADLPTRRIFDVTERL
jgi:hypothetical protein